MLTRTELERSGSIVLLRQQFVGVSGQVCSTTFEIAGPRPGHFRTLPEAQAAFAMARADAVEGAA